jgi:hypothetical protein
MTVFITIFMFMYLFSRYRILRFLLLKQQQISDFLNRRFLFLPSLDQWVIPSIYLPSTLLFSSGGSIRFISSSCLNSSMGTALPKICCRFWSCTLCILCALCCSRARSMLFFVRGLCSTFDIYSLWYSSTSRQLPLHRLSDSFQLRTWVSLGLSSRLQRLF